MPSEGTPPRLHHQVDGPESAPVVLLLNPIGTTVEIWAPQVVQWSGTFRVVRYDARGHGRSEAARSIFSIDDLGADALRVLDALDVESAHVCGVSLGGLTALWLAAHHPGRVRSLVAADTAARIGTRQRWDERIETVRTRGMDAVADIAMPAWFTERFRAEHPETLALCRRMVAATDPDAYIGCCIALREADLSTRLGSIRARTLVIAGEHDTSTPPSDAMFLHGAIGHSRLVTLPGAHITNLECAPAFSHAAQDCFAMGEGEAARRRVLGDAHVDRAMREATPFTADFQEYITRSVWGTLWTRPGLDERARRLVVIGTMIALGRWDELAMHVRAAIREGDVTADEIKEVILQQAAYCGVPAAHHALRIAVQALEDGRP